MRGVGGLGVSVNEDSYHQWIRNVIDTQRNENQSQCDITAESPDTNIDMGLLTFMEN